MLTTVKKLPWFSQFDLDIFLQAFQFINNLDDSSIFSLYYVRSSIFLQNESLYYESYSN